MFCGGINSVFEKHGRKGSLNVAVAFGVAGFALSNRWREVYGGRIT
jgi:hypothetical protein